MAIFARKQVVKATEAATATEATNGTHGTQAAPAGTEAETPGPVAALLAVGESASTGVVVAKPADVAPEVVASGGVEASVGSAPAAATDGITITDVGVAVGETPDIDAEDIEPEPAFGIADAIQLMRSLPNDPNMELVVRVVRVTLGAVAVSVEEIIQDAARREKKIQDSIAVLQGHAADLEKQLYAKRCEIAAHEADLRETVSVRERLYQADKYTGNRPPPAPLAATRVPAPRPGELGHSDHSKNE